MLQAVINASGIRSSTPNPSLYVTVVVLGKKVYKTTTSLGPTPSWDTGCELSVVSLRRLSMFVNTCASRIIESSSILSFRLKRSRRRLAPVLLVGSVNISAIDLLHQCSGEQRKYHVLIFNITHKLSTRYNRSHSHSSRYSKPTCWLPYCTVAGSHCLHAAGRSG
jgi:hypothetical protein